MGSGIQSQVNGQTIAADQPARRVHEQRVGCSGFIQIDRWKQMPRSRAVGARQDRFAVAPDIVKPKTTYTPDEFRQGILGSFF